MLGVRIEDGTNKDQSIALPPGEAGFLSFDLAEILAAIGDRAEDCQWQIRDLDCFGESYGEFVAAYEAARPISGGTLLDLARRITQIIDGEFVARVAADEAPWLEIKAIDSSWWEVWTNDQVALASLRHRFHAVSEIDAQTD